MKSYEMFVEPKFEPYALIKTEYKTISNKFIRAFFDDKLNDDVSVRRKLSTKKNSRWNFIWTMSHDE